eukprot:5561311-Alexandrium_andersonii.AAC.1
MRRQCWRGPHVPDCPCAGPATGAGRPAALVQWCTGAGCAGAPQSRAGALKSTSGSAAPCRQR